tara:strand:- start:1815 stop:2045 length:231 start_codon:yes stop_codon:yes gene_type:complete
LLIFATNSRDKNISGSVVHILRLLRNVYPSQCERARHGTDSGARAGDAQRLSQVMEAEVECIAGESEEWETGSFSV